MGNGFSIIFRKKKKQITVNNDHVFTIALFHYRSLSKCYINTDPTDPLDNDSLYTATNGGKKAENNWINVQIKAKIIRKRWQRTKERDICNAKSGKRTQIIIITNTRKTNTKREREEENGRGGKFEKTGKTKTQNEVLIECTPGDSTRNKV